MTFKVMQGHWKWHELIGHMILPISVCSNNVSISHHLFDTTTFYGVRDYL